MFEKLTKQILDNTIDLRGKQNGKSSFDNQDILPIIQEKGVFSLCKILSLKNYAYLADEVGLGKTYQAMGVISMFLKENKNSKVLIITPNTTVQKNWENELSYFCKTNLLDKEIINFDKDVKNFANKNHSPNKDNYNERQELKKAIANNENVKWNKINIIKLSSFSTFADLIISPVKKIKNTDKQKYDLKILLETLTQEKNHLRKGTFIGTQEAGIICASFYNKTVKPKFGLIVIDESQNLRNKNNQTTFLNFWLGLKRFSENDSAEINELMNFISSAGKTSNNKAKILFLSATPNHRSKDTLRNVLEYVESNDEFLNKLDHDDLKTFLIRRLRIYNKNETKYDVRNSEVHDVSYNTNKIAETEQKLMLAIIQSKLAQIEGGKSNSTFKTGFLECFECYPSKTSYKIQNKGKEEYFHRERGNAPDREMMNNLYQSFSDYMAENDENRKFPPHPKFDYMEEEIRKLLDYNTPEKCVIFVRRLASVRELKKRFTEEYEKKIISSWLNRLNLTGKKPQLEILQKKVEDLYNRTSVEESDENDSVVEYDSQDNDQSTDDSDEMSAFMRWIAQKAEIEGENSEDKDPYKAVSKFKKSMAFNRMNSFFFDENYYRSLYSDCEENEYINIVNKCVTDEFVLKVNDYIHSAPDTFYTSNGAIKKSNLLVLISCLAMQQDVYNITNKIEINEILEFYNISKGICKNSNKKILGKKEIIDILLQTSIWNECIYQKKVPQLKFGNIQYYKREVLKLITEKAIKGSEYILELMIAFCQNAEFKKKSVTNSSMIINETIKNLFDINETKFSERINLLFDNSDAVFKQVSGGLKNHNRENLVKTYLANINDQDWVKGATGGDKDNEGLIKRFNTPFYPEVIVCTDVLKEGINLHMFCNRVYHYGLAWNSGDLEQRVGRIDRFYSKTYRNRKAGDKTEKIEIGYPYMGKTVDENQLKNILIQKTNNDILMDTDETEDRNIKLDRNDPRTPEQILDFFNEECTVDASPYDGKQFWENEGWT